MKTSEVGETDSLGWLPVRGDWGATGSSRLCGELEEEQCRLYQELPSVWSGWGGLWQSQGEGTGC